MLKRYLISNIYFLFVLCIITYIGVQVYVFISVRSSNVVHSTTTEPFRIEYMRKWRYNNQTWAFPSLIFPKELESFKVSNQITRLFSNKTKKKVFLSIGIRSAIAWKNDLRLLNSTLNSIFKYSQDGENATTNDFVVVVFLNGISKSKNIEDASVLHEVFKKFCDDGRLQLFHLSTSGGTNFSVNLRSDSTASNLSVLSAKENTDKSLLSLVSKDISEYYIEMKVGSICGKEFLVTIRSCVGEYNKTWSLIKFGNDDSWGILFRSSNLKDLAGMMMKTVDTIPSKYYLQTFGNTVSYTGPPLFLTEVTSDLTADNSKQDLISELVRGKNPPATLYTDMPTFEDYCVKYAYDRDVVTYFWTAVIDVNSYLTVKFMSPQNIARVLVTTGNYINRDKLRFGFLKFGHSFDDNTKECFDVRFQWRFIDGFVDTLFQGDNNKLDEIICMFIHIKSRQRDWLIIRDFFVVPK